MAKGSVTQMKTASWGVYARTDKVSGVITDFENSSEAVIAPEQNEMGSVINQTMYDMHKTISMTIQVKSTTTPPVVGSKISIDNNHYYVTSARVVESNSAYRKIAISAESFALCTETESATGIPSGAGS